MRLPPQVMRVQFVSSFSGQTVQTILAYVTVQPNGTIDLGMTKRVLVPLMAVPSPWVRRLSFLHVTDPSLFCRKDHV